ncbi:MAG: hypothetical protein IJT32_06405 [Lachnospiraceae bacterium]|nr:hypothetical protein [Lachnospiraceae bacterium]
MAISEKELKLLFKFVSKDLADARKETDVEKKNKMIEEVEKKLQEFIED